MNENAYYNAINIHCGGDYKKIANIRKGSPSWEHAWQEKIKEETRDPQKELALLKKQNISILLATDPEFPPLLREIPHPPHALYVKGAIEALQTIPHKKTIAIVGTRNPTPEGKLIAQEFARVVSHHEITVVSGLAFGIDAAAHEAVLDAKGTTVAVVATGVDTVYPRNHHHIAQKIIEAGGALVSEYHIGAPAYPARFLERNRIISGLSSAVIIIEAPLASGSLATARFALEQNRDVLVVPGPANHSNYAGSHQLIRSGATLTATTEQLLEDLDIQYTPPRTTQKRRYGTLEESLVLETLHASHTPLSLDKICEITKLSIQVATVATTNLLLSHAIKETDIGFTTISTRHR